jgi:hypothetical protein
MDTPLAMINLALEGKIDFLKKTNPWGSAKDEDDVDLLDRKPDPQGAAKQLLAFVAAAKAKPLPDRK